MTHGIIAAHGGHVSVFSQSNAGTRFDIYFPALDVSDIPQELPDPAIRGGDEHVMLVDDEETVVDLARELLMSIGYKVSAFTKSLEALDAFSAAPDSFDIIVTDHTMPELIGTDLAKRAQAIRPDIPVIIVTGFAGATLAEADSDEGIADIVLKPFSRRQLDNAIRRTLEYAN